MGGQIDFAALPIVIDIIGVPDPELFIRGLCDYRDLRASRRGQ